MAGAGYWNIQKTELKVARELGHGNFGNVYKGTWRGRDVAIKMMSNAMDEDDFIREALVMRDLEHKNIVKLYGPCIGQGPVWIVMELILPGCLLKYIRNHNRLIENDYIKMAIQICAAMCYLEKERYFHRDLAARNCLIDENNVVKVADFGLARFVANYEYTASEGTAFPIKWSAPEVFNGRTFSSKSDVWSYGILLWELWSGGKIPYPYWTQHQHVMKNVLMGYHPEKPKPCRKDIYEIMESCWNLSAKERPSFATIYQRLDNARGDNDICPQWCSIF